MTAENSVASRQTPALLGWFYGFVAVLIWGSYIAYARFGVNAGLNPADFAFMRFASSGLVMLPFLLRQGIGDLMGVGWPRGIVIMLLTGPLFIVLSTAGFQFAPLAHGAVLQPGTATIAGLLFAIFMLGDKPDPSRLFGTLIVLIGLVTVAGSSLFSLTTPDSWKGDLLFIIAGLCWALFTILLKRWRIDAIPATAIVAVLSAFIIVPYYLAFVGFAHFLSIPTHVIVVQVVVQGLLSGVVAMMAFSQAVKTLGGAKAAVFPALVPATAILAGIPVAGELPTLLQTVGLIAVSVGLLLAIGVVRIGGRRGRSAV
ncbi:MAG: DMT family transporter [Beijerinckiaceae bacterium]|nr:DMT family transporter [Beijerinckiaceae bacterium]